MKVGSIMKKHWAIALPLLVLVGCQGPEDKDGDGIIDGVRTPDSVSVVAPATPKGTVSGQVLNSRQEPMTDASVTLTIGSATTDAPVATKTDAAGNFMFSGVPAGSQVLATISKQGFATARISVTVPSAAGNIPINNGNANVGSVSLAELNSTVRFILVTPSGRPAAGAQAYIEAFPAAAIVAPGTATGASSGVTPVGMVVGAAVAGPDGTVAFSGMPSPSEVSRLSRDSNNAGYRLWVDPVDSNGDGVIDAAGESVTYYANKMPSGPQVLTLSTPLVKDTSGFVIVATNVPSLAYATGSKSRDPLNNLVRGGESIYVSFSQPVQRESLVATITDEGGLNGFQASATANATSDGYTIAIPSGLSIVEGQKYNILLRATSAYTGDTPATWRGYFISGDVKSPRSITGSNFATVAFKDAASGTANALDSGECVVVTFNQAIIPTPSGIPVEAYLNADLGPGNATGEFSASSGFPLFTLAPPVTGSKACVDETLVYPVDRTSFVYTPRYYFTAFMSGSPAPTVPTGTTVRLAFNKHYLNNYAAYETAWGTPLTQNVEVPLTKL